MAGPHAVLSRWRERRQSLQDLIQTKDPDRWIWTIKLKVLTFLLSRYDDGESEAPMTRESVPSRMNATWFTHSRKLTPPSSPEVIRSILEDIRLNVLLLEAAFPGAIAKQES